MDSITSTFHDGITALSEEASVANRGYIIIGKIEAFSIEVFQVSKQLAELREQASEIVTQITAGVAACKEFTNEMARKAEINARLSLHAAYCQFEDDIRRVEYDLAFSQSKLERARNEFALHKLERRERLAAVEALAA